MIILINYVKNIFFVFFLGLLCIRNYAKLCSSSMKEIGGQFMQVLVRRVQKHYPILQ